MDIITAMGDTVVATALAIDTVTGHQSMWHRHLFMDMAIQPLVVDMDAEFVLDTGMPNQGLAFKHLGLDSTSASLH